MTKTTRQSYTSKFKMEVIKYAKEHGSYQKTLKNGILSVPAWRSAKKRIAWRTSRQACLLCPWARHLTGCLRVYVADMWPSRTSPDYNCEVANPACQTTLGYPPMAVRLVDGGATRHSRLVRNGLPSFL